nr:histidine phosphatase family protein [Streptomyces sp. Rer75]
MTATATRHLYLTRHGEATPDERALTDDGRRQAVLLGKRLRHVPLTAIHHSPLPRAAQTARLIAAQLNDVPAHACEPAGDYVPHTPERDELPPEAADVLLDFVHRVPADERAHGPRLAHEARGCRVDHAGFPTPGTASRGPALVARSAAALSSRDLRATAPDAAR